MAQPRQGKSTGAKVSKPRKGEGYNESTTGLNKGHDVKTGIKISGVGRSGNKNHNS